jgi:hypothetical protein
MKMPLEARLIRAHVELQVTPKDANDCKSVPLARYGAYEVRLVEPLQNSGTDAFEFWLELFDDIQKISLDSAGANDFEEATTLAKELIAHAEELSEK